LIPRQREYREALGKGRKKPLESACEQI